MARKKKVDEAVSASKSNPNPAPSGAGADNKMGDKKVAAEAVATPQLPKLRLEVSRNGHGDGVTGKFVAVANPALPPSPEFQSQEVALHNLGDQAVRALYGITGDEMDRLTAEVRASSLPRHHLRFQLCNCDAKMDQGQKQKHGFLHVGGRLCSAPIMSLESGAELLRELQAACSNLDVNTIKRLEDEIVIAGFPLLRTEMETAIHKAGAPDGSSLSDIMTDLLGSVSRELRRATGSGQQDPQAKDGAGSDLPPEVKALLQTLAGPGRSVRVTRIG